MQTCFWPWLTQVFNLTLSPHRPRDTPLQGCVARRLGIRLVCRLGFFALARPAMLGHAGQCRPCLANGWPNARHSGQRLAKGQPWLASHGQPTAKGQPWPAHGPGPGQVSSWAWLPDKIANIFLNDFDHTQSCSRRPWVPAGCVSLRITLCRY